MNKTIYKIILGGLIGLMPMMSFAQESVITGQVLDEISSEGIPGATVMIKGTSVGAITDIEGNYSIKAESKTDTLVISFIGYLEETIPAGGRSVVNITLKESLTQLEEIVVIGYGTQKKKVVTGAISSVSAEQISSTPVLRIEQALQGRTPGVQVTNLSGQPGEAPTVRIRGAGTAGNAEPLYVVDGFVVGGIDFLNPGDIESMDVLKDAASAAIYGSRAANGVVLITTKSGVKGRMSVTYEGYYGVQNVTKKLDMLDADEYRMIMNEGARNGGITEPFDLNEVAEHNTDWQAALFTDNAAMSNHQIQMSGGGDKSTFSSSFSMFSQEGIIGGEKSKFERFTARLNSKHQVNKMFSMGNNLTYSHIIKRNIGSNQSFSGVYSGALNMDPLTPLYESDADVLSLPPYSNEPVVSNDDGQIYGVSKLVGSEVVNPLALLAIDNAETRVDKLVGNVYAELEPIAGLKLRTTLSTDLAFVLDDDFKDLYFLNSAQNNTNNTSVTKTIKRYFTWQWDNTITYAKKVGDHNFAVLGGVSALEYQFEDLSGFNGNVPTFDPDNVYLDLATDTVWTAGGGADHAALFSLFGRITYDYKDRYSFTGIVRRDGSSKFGANNRFGLFPSLGLAWIASEERFLQNYLGPINLMKFRASWGVNGNENISSYQFVSPLLKNRGYTFAGGRVVGSSPERVANADIQWEESEQLDIALDLGMFENRLTLTVDYYKKTTNKLLENLDITAFAGNAPAEQNVGNIENKGIEMALGWRSEFRSVGYSINANAAYNRNEVTRIANANKFVTGASWSVAGEVSRATEGFPIAYFLGYESDGIFQSEAEVFQHINSTGEVLQPNAVPGDVRFVDYNNDGVISEEDRTIIGNPTPDWTFGVNGSLDYKGLDFSFLLVGSLGNDVLNGSQRQDLRYTNRTTAILDRWTEENPSSSMPRYTWSDVNNNARVSDLYIEDASFMRVKNVQLGYSLPNAFIEKIGATKWRFYVSVENLLTVTKYTGADPEIGTNPDSSLDIGIDRGIYPQARTFRMGTSITF